MSAWGYNLAILKGRWPDIAKRIEAVTLERCTALNGTPSQALIYRDKQITSAFDPLDEAKRQAEHLDRDAECVYCYGLGLGHLPAVLAARHKSVCVIIMNVEIARAALEASEQRWLTAPHVALALAEDVDILYVPYAGVPMECRLADQQGWATRDRFFALLNQRCIEDFHFGRSAERDKGHIADNQKHVNVDKHVQHLFGIASGSKAVIVGGGPTLLDELEWLRAEKQSGTIIVAVSTALSLLLKHDIKPDYTCIVDTDPRMMGHLEGITSEQTKDLSLIYHPTVVPSFIEHWKGPRYFFANNSEIFTSGTVTHTAADVAVKLGASQITLLGCDFCYPGQKSHIPGVMDFEDIKLRPTLLETIDGNGQQVYTDFNLAQYHRHMEDYIAQSGKGPKWYKRGKGGVTVRGAEWMC